MLLEKCVNSEYGKTIRSVHKRLITEQFEKSNGEIELQYKLVQTSNVNGQMDIELSWMLIHTVIMLNREVEIMYREDNKHPVISHTRDARAEFGHGWGFY